MQLRDGGDASNVAAGVPVHGEDATGAAHGASSTVVAEGAHEPVSVARLEGPVGLVGAIGRLRKYEVAQRGGVVVISEIAVVQSRSHGIGASTPATSESRRDDSHSSDQVRIFELQDRFQALSVYSALDAVKQ